MFLPLSWPSYTQRPTRKTSTHYINLSIPGISESAFFPLVIYYLTTFYRRSELARRLAIFYAASNISNAFSGLLAYGVFQIKNSPLPNWRWLFLIEGSCTLFFSIFVWFYLPSSAATAKFLSPEEKALAFHRIQVDSSSIVNEEFNLRDAIQVFKEPVSYAFLAIEVCLGVPLQSVALFSPQIINALGYDTVTTNLYTVAPAVSGAVMLLILAFSSDFTRMRFPFIALGFTFTFVGFLVYTTATTLRVAYFGESFTFISSLPFPWLLISRAPASHEPTDIINSNLHANLGHIRALRPPLNLVQQQ